MDRRTFLGVAGTATAASLAGCLGAFETTAGRGPAVLDDRPDAVYMPTHREGMEMVGTASAGELTVAVTYSYPHRFWTVDNEGGEYVTNRIEIERDDAVHLMSTVFHEPTGTVVPATGVSVEVTQDGSLVSQETIYPMLSQRMGFHYGGNFSLEGDGDYAVTVSVGGTNLARFGAFEGLFADAASATVDFAYSEATRNEITYTLLDDEAGMQAALSPMEMGTMPTGDAPDPLAGQRIGEAMSGDARFVVQQLSADRFLGDESGTYVAVSAQTPYNRLVIPGMGLDMTVNSADGDTRFDGRLAPGLDPDLGFHYGAVVDALQPGDGIDLSVSTVPQVARHEGYETAFLDMDDMSLMVPESSG